MPADAWHRAPSWSAVALRIALLVRPRHLDLLPDRALEQVRVSPRRPDRHRGALTARLGRDGDRAVRPLNGDAGDRLVARALQLLREPDDRREQRQPLVVLLARERAELRRIRVALAVVAGDQR